MSKKEEELTRKLKFARNIIRHQSLLLDEYRQTIKSQDLINQSLRIENYNLKNK